jgi:hypothetical protein
LGPTADGFKALLINDKNVLKLDYGDDYTGM